MSNIEETELKLMRNSLFIMIFSTFSYTVSSFTDFNLVHPIAALGLFIFGFSFFILGYLLLREQEKQDMLKIKRSK